MITRLPACILALASAAALATACSGGDTTNRPVVLQPAPTATATGTDAPPGTPSPAASRPSGPARGSAVDEATRRELLSLPERYYGAIEHAYRTGDYKPVEELVSPECIPCRAQLNYLREAAEKNYQHELGNYTVTNVRLLDRSTATENHVSIQLAFDGLIVKDADGKTVAEDPAQRGPQQLNVALQDGRWLITEVYNF